MSIPRGGRLGPSAPLKPQPLAGYKSTSQHHKILFVWWPWSASGRPCAAKVAGVWVVRCGGKLGWWPEIWCWQCAGCDRSAGCRGGSSESLTVLKVSISCRVDEDVALDVGHRRHFSATPRMVGFFIYVRVSRLCSSHSSRSVFILFVVKRPSDLGRVVFRIVPRSWMGLAVWRVFIVWWQKAVWRTVFGVCFYGNHHTFCQRPATPIQLAIPCTFGQHLVGLKFFFFFLIMLTKSPRRC
jgi:hypothetical protein